jgi:hypothetical protein
MRKIGVIAQKINGKTFHRLYVPFSHNQEATIFDGFDMENNKPTDYDILVLNTNFIQPIEMLIHAKKQGVKIVLDIDDWVKVPSKNHQYNEFHTPRNYEKQLKVIELADVIWVASEMLYKEFKNAKTHYIPNALDITQNQWNLKRTNLYDVVWGGGGTHYEDINRFQKDVKFATGLYAGLKGVDTDKAQYIKWLDPLEYGQIYRHGKIAIAPLANTIFNSFKSNIKALEGAAYKLPFVCSNVAPYNSVPTPYKCSSKAEWISAIRKLRLDAALRDDMGAILNEWMTEKHNLTKLNEIRWQTLA